MLECERNIDPFNAGQEVVFMWYYVLGILYVGVILYFANKAIYNRAFETPVRWLQYTFVTLIVLLGVNVLVTAQLYSASEDNPRLLELVGEGTQPIPLGSAALFMAFTAAMGYAAFQIIRSEKLRIRLKQYVFRTSFNGRSYEPNSPIHTTALVLMIFIIVNTASTFVLVGGIDGVAESFQNNAIDINSFVFDAVVYVLLSLLAVGLYIRRTLQQTLARLGIWLPENREYIAGVGGGLLLYGGLIVAAAIWGALSPEQTMLDQTAAAQEIFGQVSGSLLTGLLMAISTAIGEEVLFRGALQPIFGMFFTTLFFALIHLQYTLTPAALIIFGVGLGLAYIRKRYGTVAAILAHFTYNFIPFILVFATASITG